MNLILLLAFLIVWLAPFVVLYLLLRRDLKKIAAAVIEILYKT